MDLFKGYKTKKLFFQYIFENKPPVCIACKHAHHAHYVKGFGYVFLYTVTFSKVIKKKIN